MSTETVANIPQLTLGWRLQMALGHAGMSVQDMADELGMSRTSLSRWLNDRGTPPRTVFLKQWALRTGVSSEWLLTGEVASSRPTGPGGGVTTAASDQVSRQYAGLAPVIALSKAA